MAGTVQSDSYRAVISTLVDVRTEAALSQAGLARLIGKPPSFVGKYELGERRLDIVELMVILRALEIEFEKFWGRADVELPGQL